MVCVALALELWTNGPEPWSVVRPQKRRAPTSQRYAEVKNCFLSCAGASLRSSKLFASLMELHGAEGDDERLLALMDQVKIKNREMVQSLSTEEVEDLLLKYSFKEPGAFSDIMYMVQHRNDPLPSAGLPAAPWCTCGNCKDLPTDQERICCGQEPCITRLPRFTLHCLSGGHLRLQRQQRGDYKPATEPGEDHREFRNAAYRNYIRWQSGSLDGGRNHVAVPSCVVWAVTDHFPDPSGQYPAYVPDH